MLTTGLPGKSLKCTLYFFNNFIYLFLVVKKEGKKVGKTTRPFSYDLNQIPYEYTVEVRNSFKGLDLIDRVPEIYGQRLVTL